jgi:hypothetical protein
VRIGDLFEWLAAICLVTAVVLLLGVPASLIAAALFLFYQGQCHAMTPIRLRRDKPAPEPAPDTDVL